MKHSNLGASGAHRWLYCPGSVAAEAALPDASSIFAEEGTRAHDLAELALRTGSAALDLFEDEEMAGFVRVYTEYVERLSVDADLVMIEERVDYSDWVDGGFGTADAVVLRGNSLHVCDLKYGMGVPVSADENQQGMLYALGAYAAVGHLVDVESVTISIIQPRLDSISEWAISVPDLLRWADWVAQRAEATKAPDAPRVPGEKTCRWCNAKHNCGALLKATTDALLTEFDDLDNLPNPDTLTDDQIGAALAAKALIEGWLNAVAGHVKGRLESGEGFPGYKLVAGRSSRSWKDEDDAAKELCKMIGADRAIVTKLISPAQAEKALGAKRKGDIADMIAVKHGAASLAPESDTRPAINVSINDFDVVNDQKTS